jgi:hypothetical protein
VEVIIEEVQAHQAQVEVIIVEAVEGALGHLELLVQAVEGLQALQGQVVKADQQVLVLENNTRS